MRPSSTVVSLDENATYSRLKAGLNVAEKSFFFFELSNTTISIIKAPRAIHTKSINVKAQFTQYGAIIKQSPDIG